MPLTHREALEVLAAHRGVHVVVTTHGSIDLWTALSDAPRDLAYVPATMGQAPGLGLGLALARPGLGVAVVCGDGHLLMNLGCLVTLAHHPADVYLLIIDNGVYEVTGAQLTPGSGRTDFAGLARAAGNPARVRLRRAAGLGGGRRRGVDRAGAGGRLAARGGAGGPAGAGHGPADGRATRPVAAGARRGPGPSRDDLTAR
jgi:TPP-dependent trihydroxycyclohexane-1,2-dione (THcHDO) dehydratase